jgi:cytochrome b561
VEPRYRPIAQALHWLIAVSVIGLIIAGLIVHYNLIPKPGRVTLALLHISVGLTILGLMLLRLAYRLGRTPPRLPETIAPHERALAAAGHWSFYALILAMPVFGVLFVEGAGRPVTWFGLVRLPQFVGKSQAIHHDFAFLHFWGGIVLIVLLVVHVGAVIAHERRGQRVLIRMMPRRSPSNGSR